MDIIHTGLYSDTAFKILDGAMHAITQHSGRFWNKINDIVLERLPNNEVVFNCQRGGVRSFKNFKSELEAKIWFARTMKMIVNEAPILWSRINQNAATRISFSQDKHPTIQQVYFIYDVLIERKRLELKYSKEFIEDLLGTERDDIATELEIERRTQIADIKAKYKKPLHDANPDSYGIAYDEMQKKMSAFRQTLKAEYSSKYEALKKQMQDEIDAVNATADAAINNQAAFMTA